MVKNPKPPQQGGLSKKQQPKQESNASNSKASNTKNGAPNANSSAASAESSKVKGKVKSAQNETLLPVDDVPKKPTTRELLAGTSWTGKLPLNLFSEHCQRAKWEKPEYGMHRIPTGFISSVVLRQKNPKTQEVTQLPPMRLPKERESLAVRETAVEARHVAATWALFRVASGKSIHMTLPPQFKDLWKGPFNEIKAEDKKAGKAWLYSEDPFQAHKEHEEEKAKALKQREEAQKDRAKREEARASGDLLAAASGDPMRGWKTAPRVEIGRKVRREIEALVRSEGVWNANEVKIRPEVCEQIIEELSKLGFRKAHVAEAVGICKDKEEALEWLLIHVPEDDLPKWALPEGYVAGVSMAGDARREAIIKRLSSAGYSQEACQDALDECKGHEIRAAWLLQNSLLQNSDDKILREMPYSLLEMDQGEEDQGPWTEEQGVLSSIYGERYSFVSTSSCCVRLESAVDSKKVTIRLHRGHQDYPKLLPILQVCGTLPAYIKLSITIQALTYAAHELQGQPMIFNIIDWLESNIQEICAKPGRLSTIAAANAGTTVSQPMKLRPNARRRDHIQPLDMKSNTSASQQILTEWQSRQHRPAQQKLLLARQSLPAWSKRNEIVSVVNSHQVTIISGATGSGKSTQTVQFIVDDLIQRHLGTVTNIVCTQPRRISALGLADRVAEERCGAVGEEVGYAIRGESKHGKNTRIRFCTIGVLLRRLQTSGGSRDALVRSLADTSHVVVDEVHERSLDTDFLLALLRDVLDSRKDLKVVLMSATLDAAAFESYFGRSETVGKVDIEGRTFPVQDFFMDDVVGMTGFLGERGIEDAMVEPSAKGASMSKVIQSLGFGINYQLISSIVRHIDVELGDEPGGVLIFLPGTVEISRTLEALRSLPNIYALPLHASLPPAEQRRVFPPAPKGKRKIIAATNVAETSITIPDIVAVIDSGRVKETRYDAQSSMVKLVEVWASKAACQQRRGRAGRVRAGKNYKLFTRQAEAERMPDKPEPEIRRTPLEQLCLSVKAMGVKDVSEFLANTITPPEAIAVEGALTLLRRMGALDGNVLTALGHHMAMIPADLRCSKLMILGALFDCLDACLTIASILTVKSPFVSPQDKRDEANAARQSFSRGQNIGDLITDMRAFDAWHAFVQDRRPYREIRAWCESNFLSTQTLQDIASTRSQYISSLTETSFLPPTTTTTNTQAPYLNANADSTPLLSTLILASLSPQTLRILYPPTKYTSTSTGNLPLDPTAKSIQFFDETNQRVFIHPSSTLFSSQSYPGNPGFMSYFTKLTTSKIFARELCPAGTFAVLLFAGSGVEVDKLGRGVVVDGWMRVRGWARIGVLVGRLRSVVEARLRRWVERPEEIVNGRDREWVGLVRRLVELEGLDR